MEKFKLYNWENTLRKTGDAPIFVASSVENERFKNTNLKWASSARWTGHMLAGWYSNVVHYHLPNNASYCAVFTAVWIWAVLAVVVGKGRFHKNNLVKSVLICQTSLDPPPGLAFLRMKNWPIIFFWKWTIDVWKKIYTWSHLKIFLFASVISVYICPNLITAGHWDYYITLQ